jgi:hypothetical protein
VLRKNVNRHNLGNRSCVSILVPRRDKVTESRDSTTVLGNKNRTTFLGKPFLPEGCATLHIKPIQNSIGYLAAISHAPCLNVNFGNACCIGDCGSANWHETLSALNAGFGLAGYSAKPRFIPSREAIRLLSLSWG